MNQKQLAKDILSLVGGKENVGSVTHCYTRLRFNLKNNDLAEKETIESLDGVIQVQIQSGQFQVVIGNEVGKVYKEIEKQGNFSSEESDNAAQEEEKAGNIIGRFFEMIASIFTPIIPAIAGAGLVKGILGLVTTLEWAPEDSDIVSVLNIVADAVFYFLPFFLAVSAAKKFKTNEFIALALAGGFMYPTLIEGAQAIAEGGAEGLSLFGLPVPFIDYSSTVIPIIIAVWLLSYVNRWVDAIMPSAVRIIFTPTIVLLIMIPFQLVAIGPLGSYLGVGLADGITWLFEHVGVLAGGLLGATRPLLVIVGMHYGLMPIAIQNVTVLGFDYLVPVFLMANMGQAAAALAVFIKTQNRDLKTIAASSTISAFLGITEPAMYGVNLRLKKPFIAALIGSGIGGAFITGFGVTASAFVLPGLTSLPVFSGPRFIYLIIGLVITIAVTMILTFVLGFKDIEKKKQKTEPDVVPSDKDEQQSTVNETIVKSPVEGKMIPLQEVSDPTFAEGLLGQGVAIEPANGKVIAPFDGSVVSLFETKHAIGLRSEEGLELLIHVGLDTVNLEGKYFEAQVEQGQEIKQGDLLIACDIEKIKQAGYPTVTPVIVTNSSDYQDVRANDGTDQLKQGEWLLKTVKA
ncbi:beta-glucoside-specific PTS transporter subunit IIABC [Virgibacillus sp. NKC19-3]|uniref:beta-glucoside-specific PTS transporter subunit IIABC n=1 Tax=Virgibacillus saliphilus TaxID=2831674 RepID=UPI001C9B1C97|nr:beta-glucoside-specific PTS transporter subunit IIABC [Virgibacillus sp. NKC19-3]MBY7141988.1 beta-glucoside-specific PTS transporter subunit IIABC [Virgibacillus sp. NKC19-3]